MAALRKHCPPFRWELPSFSAFALSLPESLLPWSPWPVLAKRGLRPVSMNQYRGPESNFRFRDENHESIVTR